MINRNDLDVIKDLLWIGGLRGTDNTGVASVKYDKWDKVDYLKITGGPYELLDRKSLDNVIKIDTAFIMGHNRSKTFGTTAPKDAHPFVFDNIVGCHNGTLTWQSKNKMKDDTKFGTDSEALFWDINENGFEDTIKRMDGAWALVWYDRRTKEINFHRNKERPLCYVLDKQNSTMYWASEPGFLYLALNRRGVEFNGKVKIVPENTWVRWQVNDKKGFTLDKPIHRNLVAPPFVHSPPNYHPGYHSMDHVENHGHANGKKVFPIKNNHQHNGSSHTQTTVADNKITVQGNPEETRTQNLVRLINHGTGIFDEYDKKKISTSQEVIELYEKGKLDLDVFHKASDKTPGYYLSPDGLYIFRSQFTSLVSDGCCLCSEVPAWGEPIKILKDSQFVCVPCLYDRQGMETTVQLIRSMLV